MTFHASGRFDHQIIGNDLSANFNEQSGGRKMVAGRGEVLSQTFIV